MKGKVGFFGKRSIALLFALALLWGLLPVRALATEEEPEWSIGIYLCGSDLEGDNGAASMDILEMMSARIPENVTLYVLAGGSKSWLSTKSQNYLKLNAVKDWIQNGGALDNDGEVLYEYNGDTYGVAPNAYLVQLTKNLENYDIYNLMTDEDSKPRLFKITGSKWAGGKITQCGSITEISTGLPSDDQEEDDEISILPHYDSDYGMGSTYLPCDLFDFMYTQNPGAHKAFIFWDHGGGPNGSCMSDTCTGYGLNAKELRQAAEDMAKTNGGKLDLIGFDACLMASTELAYALSPYADYLVASEETEPSTGWWYEWLSTVGKDYDKSGTADAVDVGKAIVDYYGRYSLLNNACKYADEDDRDFALATMPEALSAAEGWSAAGSNDLTLSLIDLNQIDTVRSAVDAFGTELYKLMEGMQGKSEKYTPKTAKALYGVVARAAERADSMDRSSAPTYNNLLDLHDLAYEVLYGLNKEGWYSDDGDWAEAAGLIDALDSIVKAFTYGEAVTNVGSLSGGAVLYRGAGATHSVDRGLTLYYPVKSDFLKLWKNAKTANERVSNYHDFFNDETADIQFSDDYEAFLREVLVNQTPKSSLGRYGGAVQTGRTTKQTRQRGEGETLYYMELTEEEKYAVLSVDHVLTYMDSDGDCWYLGETALNLTRMEGPENGTYSLYEPANAVQALTIDGVSCWCDLFKGGENDRFLHIPALVGEDTTPSTLHFVKNAEKDEYTLYGVTPYGTEGQSWAERMQEPASSFTFRPVLYGFDPDECCVLTNKLGETGKITWTTGSTVQLEDGETASSLDAFYVGFFKVTDLTGEEVWSDWCPYAMLPGSFTGADGLEGLAKKIPDQSYTGGERKPEVSFGVWDRIFLTDADYTLTYQDNVAPGTASVTVTAKEGGTYDAFAGESFSLTFRIVPPSSSGGGSAREDSVKTVENKDGSKDTVTTKADGSTGNVHTSPEGTVISASATVSSAAVTAAAKSGTPVSLALEVPAASSVADAPEIKVTMPHSVSENNPVTIHVPVTDVTPGTVLVTVDAKGQETIVTKSVVTEDGVAMEVTGAVTLKVVDNAKSFRDTDSISSEFQQAVAYVSSRELFNGTAPSTFSPDRAMTRQMLFTVLARLDGQDTSRDAYGQGMEWAVARGITDGSKPEQDLTRQQLAAMLYRYAGEPAVNGNKTAEFADAATVSHYAKAAVEWCVQKGILNGTGGNLDPAAPATRAQVAAMLMRYNKAML